MGDRWLTWGKRVLVSGLVVAASFAAGATYSTLGANPVTFAACLASWGALSNVTVSPTPPKACPKGQTAVTWGQQGPQGQSAGPFTYFICPGCNFSGSLVGDRLAGKDLTDAYMPQTRLFGANLTGTNFTRAVLTSADIQYANLTGATLMNANLDGANFSEANLTGANLAGASLGGIVNWFHTTCPDGTNSNNNGGTCVGHLIS